MNASVSPASVNRSLRLLRVETMLTSAMFAMPILTVFYTQDLGMSLAQVGLSQAAFTATVMLLNVPTGWLADRFSHKWANVLGDVVAAAGFVLYALSDSFADVVISEVVVGIGMSLTHGADSTLVEAYTRRLGLSYRRVWARFSSLRILAEVVAVVVGGLVGATNPRLAIVLSAVTYSVGAVLSLGLDDIATKRVSAKHPVRDMLDIVTYALRGHQALRWSVISTALARESTHALVWILTPLLLYVGVPLPILGIAWALNLGLSVLGAEVARHWNERRADWQILAVSTTVFTVSSLGLSLWPSLLTIALYGGFGFLRGWHSALLQPLVQRHTPEGMKATVTSLTATLGHILYVPLVWMTGALGDISPPTAVAGSLALFAPLLALCTRQLYKLTGR